MSDDSKSFVIRDRRGRGDEKVETPENTGASTSGQMQADPSHPVTSAGQDHETETRPPVTFSTFIYSLGTSALMLMGEQLDPQQGRMPVNLSQAKEIIDILSMLEGKTQGNLATEERAVLTDMLYALRMKYVDLASAKQAPKSP